MGFWENETEQYPDNVIYDGTSVGNPDLRGLNVRHHRTPSLTWLANNTYSAASGLGTVELPRIGISVQNVIIPSAAQNQIKRWGIYFAKKTAANSIVVGSDLLQYNAAVPSDLNTFWSTGGNWFINAERGGTDTWEDFTQMKTSSLRGLNDCTFI